MFLGGEVTIRDAIARQCVNDDGQLNFGCSVNQATLISSLTGGTVEQPIFNQDNSYYEVAMKSDNNILLYRGNAHNCETKTFIEISPTSIETWTFRDHELGWSFGSRGCESYTSDRTTLYSDSVGVANLLHDNVMRLGNNITWRKYNDSSDDSSDVSGLSRKPSASCGCTAAGFSTNNGLVARLVEGFFSFLY